MKKFTYFLLAVAMIIMTTMNLNPAYASESNADLERMNTSIETKSIEIFLSNIGAGNDNYYLAKNILRFNRTDDLKVQPMDIKLEYPKDELKNNEEVPITSNTIWNTSEYPLNVILNGSAIVYQTENATILFGSLFGYNGEEEDSNFITQTITFDVTNNICKSVVTIGVSDEKQNSNPLILEFGAESPNFKEAYTFFAEKMEKESLEARAIEALEASETQEASINSIDTNLYWRKTNTRTYGNKSFHAFSLYSQKEMSEVGYIDVYGKSGVNTDQAEKCIIGTIDDSAWAVVPKKLEVQLRVRSNGLQLRNGTQDPVDNSSSFNITIPLPASQSLSLPIVYASTTFSKSSVSSYDGSYHYAKWDFYRLNGIIGIEATTSELGASSWNSVEKGVGCEIEMKNAVDISANTTRYIDGVSKASFHYLYFDSNGNMNNTYYTSSLSTSTISVLCKPA